MIARPRPDWRTVARTDLRAQPFAFAARLSRCRCGADVDEGDPIVCLGSQVELTPEGRQRVDLSGAEWTCDRCVREASDG